VISILNKTDILGQEYPNDSDTKIDKLIIMFFQDKKLFFGLKGSIVVGKE